MKRHFLALSCALATAVVLAGPAASNGAAPLATHRTSATTASAVVIYPCKNKTSRTVPRVGKRSVWYCTLRKKNVGVEDCIADYGAVPGCQQHHGVLHKSGYANWFVCRFYSKYVGDRAFTLSDDGLWGTVDVYAWTGWPHVSSPQHWPTLPTCDSKIMEQYIG